MQRALNLMTDQALRREQWRRKCEALTAALACSLVVAVPAAGYFVRESASLARHLEALNLDYGALWRTRVEIEGLKQLQAQLAVDQRQLPELSAPRRVTTLLALLSRLVAQSEGKLRVRQVTVDPLRGTPNAPRPEARMGRMRLETMSTPEFDVVAWAGALQQTPLERVEVTREETVEEQGTLWKICWLECQF